jgi:hypothetical protein
MRRLAVALALAALGGPACAHDVVMPDLPGTAVCGDGIVEPGEGCDTPSPGCNECTVVPDWTCPNNVCSPICGDGVVGTGSDCAGAHRDAACDMTGFWAARETDYSCDTVFHSPQTSSNWYLYQFAQSGDTFTVVTELDCGIHVTGSATVDYTLPSLRAAMYENPMDESGPYGARQGTSVSTAGGCAVSFERWYFIRGATDAYLPTDFSSDPSLASLPALPSVSDPVNGVDDPPGATDPDGDGFPGIAFSITGIVSGVRDSAQRDWKEYSTGMQSPVMASALTFEVPGSFDLQENVLHVSQCGTSCGLLDTSATASTVPVHVTFSFIGKTLGSPRVSAVVAGTPRQSVDTDLATCAAIRLVLPHDGSAPADACTSSL